MSRPTRSSKSSRPSSRTGFRPSVILSNPDIAINYKDLKLLRRCMTESSKIIPARLTGFSRSQQRLLKKAIENARFLALVPYTI